MRVVKQLADLRTCCSRSGKGILEELSGKIGENMIRTTPIMVALITGCLLSGTASAAKFYRWTDEQGATHYTQTPPPEGVETREVRTQGTASSDQPRALERLEQQRQSAQQERQRASQDAQEAERVRNNPEEVTKERCEQHRQNLEQLQNKTAVSTKDPVTGETKPLDDSAREQMLSNTLEALKLCK